MTDGDRVGPDTLRIQRTFRAPAQAVFDAWTSPEVLRRWWHAEHAWETPIARVDLRPGGEVYLVMRNPEDGREYAGRGEFTLIDPPRRLAFTWVWESDHPREQLVDVEFIAHGESTTVVMTHSGVPESETDDYDAGWQASFDNLAAALA
jgi:uncharacterized protein YndB with AHSA1/START domain